jgi:hypothetical protein
MTEPPTEEDWAAIRVAYETTPEGLGPLSRRFGLHHLSIHNFAKARGWKLRAAASGPPAAPPQFPQPPAIPRPRPNRRQGMIDRLYRVIDSNLSQLEEIMQSQSDPSIADNEKETRTIGTVIGNIEKLKGLEDDAGKSSARHTKSSSPAEIAAETERLGRELADRLIRLSRNSGT